MWYQKNPQTCPLTKEVQDFTWALHPTQTLGGGPAAGVCSVQCLQSTGLALAHPQLHPQPHRLQGRAPIRPEA